SVTTFDPGAREVFTHGLTSRPCSMAFLATRPAPSITLGLEVLVQEVIAAITIDPSLTVYASFLCMIRIVFISLSLTTTSGFSNFLLSPLVHVNSVPEPPSDNQADSFRCGSATYSLLNSDCSSS